MEEQVREKLWFAASRLSQLLALNNGYFAGADVYERQQLFQEFLFHLVGAIDILFQYVNEKRQLGLDRERLTRGALLNLVAKTDPLHGKLLALHVRVQGNPLPANAYGEEGYLFRLFNYRHHVAHRQRNPFHFAMAIPAPAVTYLLLDPRLPTRMPSQVPMEDELQRMLNLVHAHCEAALAVA